MPFRLLLSITLLAASASAIPALAKTRGCSDEVRSAIAHRRTVCGTPNTSQCKRAKAAVEKLCEVCAAACKALGEN
jgi:hypothetical protein